MIYTQESISFWSIAELQALQAYLQLKLGNVTAANAWQKRYVRPPVSQTELFVYALVCVKNGRFPTAHPLLTTLLTEVKQRPRLFTPVDVLLPLAAVYWRQANVRAAAAALKNALHISQSQRCIRPFLDWAEELEPLFQLLVTLPDVDEYGRFFLKSVGVGGERPLPHQTVLQRLAQLTGREQQLLKQVCDGATNRQIADTLTLAESTVKSHLRHVYQKLAVANRKEAAMLFAKVRRLAGNGRI
jgi:LuxR family maltose regulon positive regulatory protein